MASGPTPIIPPGSREAIARANAELLGGMPSARRIVAYALLIQRFSGQWARAVSLSTSRFPWSGTDLLTPVVQPGSVLRAFQDWGTKLVQELNNHPDGRALGTGWRWFVRWAPRYTRQIEEALVGVGTNGYWVRRYVAGAAAARPVLAANELNSAADRALLVPPSVAEELHRARFAGVVQTDRTVVLVGPPGSGKRTLAAAALVQSHAGAVVFNAERANAELVGRDPSAAQTLHAAVRRAPGGVVVGDVLGAWEPKFWHVQSVQAPDSTQHRVVHLPPPNAAARFAGVERGFRAALREHTAQKPCTDARVDAHPAVRAAWKRVARFCGPNYAKLNNPLLEWEKFARTRTVDVAPAEQVSALEAMRAAADQRLRAWSQAPPAVHTTSAALHFFERAQALLQTLPRDSPRERVRAAVDALARSLREAEEGAPDLDADVLQPRAVEVWFQGALAASEVAADAARRADVAELQQLELEELRARDDAVHAQHKEQLPRSDQNELWAFALSGEPPDAWLEVDEGPAKAAHSAARAAAAWRSHFTRYDVPLRATRQKGTDVQNGVKSGQSSTWTEISDALLQAMTFIETLDEAKKNNWEEYLKQFTAEKIDAQLQKLRELVAYDRTSDMDPNAELSAAVLALTAGNAVRSADRKRLVCLQQPRGDTAAEFLAQLDAERKSLMVQLDAATLASSKSSRLDLQEAHRVFDTWDFGLEGTARVDVRLENVLEEPPRKEEDDFHESSGVKLDVESQSGLLYWQLKICRIWKGWIDAEQVPINMADIQLDADLHALASYQARRTVQKTVENKLKKSLHDRWRQAFKTSPKRAVLSKLYDALFANSLASYHLKNARKSFADEKKVRDETLQQWPIKTDARGTEEVEGVKAALRAAYLYRVEAPPRRVQRPMGSTAYKVAHADDGAGFAFAQLEHASYRAAKAALNAHVHATLGAPERTESAELDAPWPTASELDQLLCGELARSDALVRNFQLAQRALTFDHHSKRAAKLGESIARHFEAYFEKFLPAARGFAAPTTAVG